MIFITLQLHSGPLLQPSQGTTSVRSVLDQPIMVVLLCALRCKQTNCSVLENVVVLPLHNSCLAHPQGEHVILSMVFGRADHHDFYSEDIPIVSLSIDLGLAQCSEKNNLF